MSALGIDVVDIPRLARLLDRYPEATTWRLLHPEEGDRRDARDLAASVAAKEAWIKAVGGRPQAWSFTDVALHDTPAPVGRADLGERMRLDLDLDAVAFGTLTAGTTTHDVVAGRCDSWWVAGVFR